MFKINCQKTLEGHWEGITEVLYSPEVGFNLISIGKLDKKGFSATFSDGKCSICGLDGEPVGEIPKSRGLKNSAWEGWRRQRSQENTYLELATLLLGAYIPKAAQKLVKNGFISSLRLESNPDAGLFCESCVYAKATRKIVPKAREGERAKEFDGEVHSDILQPLPSSQEKWCLQVL